MFLSVYTTEEGTEVTEETGSQEERRNGDARSFLATKEHELTNAVTPLVGFQLDMIEQSFDWSACKARRQPRSRSVRLPASVPPV